MTPTTNSGPQDTKSQQQGDDSTAALKQLVEASTALSEAERQYWLKLLPSMNAEQKAQLNDILTSEQKKMDAIDEKYDKKLAGVAEKYLARWDSEKNRAEKVKRRKEENAHQERSESEAEALLADW